MGPKTFEQIVNHLFPIRGKFRPVAKTAAEGGWDSGEYFDYPDYGGLPKKISNTLSPEAVDALQWILLEEYKTRRQFARAYKEQLRALGEPGNYGQSK